MTIAAGFSCTDGIVLLADTEYSLGQLVKVPGPKLFDLRTTGDVRAVMAGAGQEMFLRDAASKLTAMLHGDVTPSSVKTKIRGILRDIYNKDINPAHDPELSFELLIGLWFRGAPCELYVTSRTVPYEVKTCKAIGYGGELAAFILDLLYERGSVADAQLLGTYMLKMVKKYNQFCGGGTDVATISGMDGKVSRLPQKDVTTIEDFFLEFAEMTKTVFDLMTVQEDYEDVIEPALGQFAERIRDFRKRLRYGRVKGISFRPDSSDSALP